jgi:Na+/glutamate symporter
MTDSKKQPITKRKPILVGLAAGIAATIGQILGDLLLLAIHHPNSHHPDFVRAIFIGIFVGFFVYILRFKLKFSRDSK